MKVKFLGMAKGLSESALVSAWGIILNGHLFVMICCTWVSGVWAAAGLVGILACVIGGLAQQGLFAMSGVLVLGWAGLGWEMVRHWGRW